MLVVMPHAALAVVVAAGPRGFAGAAELAVGGETLPARAVAVAARHSASVVVASAHESAWAGFVAAVVGHEPPLAADSIVVLHEVERALADDGVWERVLAAAVDGAAASIPSRAVTDTVRDRHGALVDREALVECQTPRAYRVGLLRDLVDVAATDDLEALAAVGVTPTFVEGSASASAVRTADQLAVVLARTGS